MNRMPVARIPVDDEAQFYSGSLRLLNIGYAFSESNEEERYCNDTNREFRFDGFTFHNWRVENRERRVMIYEENHDGSRL